jgi:hypothetical protein
MLHDGVAETLGLERVTNRFELDRLQVTDLDNAAAGEIDSDIQP